MSSCPTKDIHSVYLDNELPVAYIAEYESHVKTCAKCQAELQKMRSLSAALKSDGKSISLDNVYMQQSYDRLMSRMRFSEVSKKAVRFPIVRKVPTAVKYFIPAAAAAALVAVFLPMRLSGMKGNVPSSQQTAYIAPITRNKAMPVSQNNVIINGTIKPSSMGATIPFASQAVAANVSNSSRLFAQPQITGTDVHVQQMNVQQINSAEVFTDVDMFIPRFDEKHDLTLKVMPSVSREGQMTLTLTFTSENTSGQLP